MSEKINYDELMDKEDPDIKVEMATMDERGLIVLIDKGALPSGQPYLGTQDVWPKDPEYIDYCKSFHLNKPGDSYYKQYRWIDEKWVLESEGVNNS